MNILFPSKAQIDFQETITCQDVVESDVLGYGRVVQDQLDVVRTICTEAVPEGQQGVFVVVDRDGRLGQLGVEERPKVVEVNTRALHRTTTPALPTEDQLLILGAQEVGHGLQIKQQGWSIIQLYSVRGFFTIKENCRKVFHYSMFKRFE